VLAHCVHGLHPAVIARWHKEYGQAISATVARASLRPASGPSASRDKLRVGLLSPDLRRHSVAYFIRPLFMHLDTQQFELHAYHLWAAEDEVSDELRAGCARWTNIARRTDEEIIAILLHDDLDILLDLGGLTSGSRPRVLAAKPAPCVISYCGYPDTTGIPGVDVRVVDALTDPLDVGAPTFDARCTEKLIRLDPCFLCYTPPADAPDVAPRVSGASIRFGSFNAVRKLNLETCKLWARVLDAVPGSTLTLKWGDLQDPGVRLALEQQLERAGLLGRTQILPRTESTRAHLSLYHDIDIALDTFPYHGTTTTCEALWMGVPVVTRVGDLHVSRVGLSLLTQVGLSDLAASTDDQYVLKAASLANDAIRLSRLRAELRDRMRASPLCDDVRWTRRFEEVLVRCAGQPGNYRFD
jgi:protein O-GlcNAc transferase